MESTKKEKVLTQNKRNVKETTIHHSESSSQKSDDEDFVPNRICLAVHRPLNKIRFRIKKILFGKVPRVFVEDRIFFHPTVWSVRALIFILSRPFWRIPARSPIQKENNSVI